MAVSPISQLISGGGDVAVSVPGGDEACDIFFLVLIDGPAQSSWQLVEPNFWGPKRLQQAGATSPSSGLAVRQNILICPPEIHFRATAAKYYYPRCLYPRPHPNVGPCLGRVRSREPPARKGAGPIAADVQPVRRRSRESQLPAQAAEGRRDPRAG